MRLQYLLPCSCGRKLPVDLAQAGNRIHCECGAELEVPTLLHLKRLERAVPADSAATVEGATWGARQRIALAGAVFSLAGIFFAAWCFTTRPRILDVAEYPPMAALRLWESLKMGIDLPPSGLEMAMFNKLEWHHRWTVVGLIVAVLGALVMCASLLIGRRSLAKPPPAP